MILIGGPNSDARRRAARFGKLGFLVQIGSDDLGQARIGSGGQARFPRLPELIRTCAPRLSEAIGSYPRKCNEAEKRNGLVFRCFGASEIAVHVKSDEP